jgi:hypothetical protein
MQSDILRRQDLFEIERLKSRYCRYVDLKQWDALRGLFVSDARFDGFGSAPPGADLGVFINGVAARLAEAVSVHHCHMPDIVFTDTDHARAVWAMEDYVEWPAGMLVREADNARGFRGYGYYEDEYVRTEQGWRIEFSRLARLRLDPVPDDGRELTRGWSKPRTDWVEAV